MDVLPDQLPWWLAGPGLGLCVVALYGLANLRLGVSGAWLASVVAPLEGWRGERWRVEFLAALVAGSLAAAALGGGFRLSLYGAQPPGLPAAALLPLLAVAGLALGYGARWAGGCTSGHGIAGCPTGSPDSLVTTATFFTVAVVVTGVVSVVTGGLL